MEKNKLGVIALCSTVLIVPLIVLIIFGVLVNMSHVVVYVLGVTVPMFFFWRIVGRTPRRDSS